VVFFFADRISGSYENSCHKGIRDNAKMHIILDQGDNDDHCQDQYQQVKEPTSEATQANRNRAFFILSNALMVTTVYSLQFSKPIEAPCSTLQGIFDCKELANL
jgi:hypothetical protein